MDKVEYLTALGRSKKSACQIEVYSDLGVRCVFD